MSTAEQKSRRAVAWDPRSPATLLLPSVDASQAKDDGFSMNTFLSHDGVGCNTHETSALMELLDAHDAYLESDVGSVTALRSLSKAYRKALCDCVQGWEDELAAAKAAEDAEPSLEENLELLKIAYAVTHLSETFLLSPSSSDAFMDYYENTSNLPGATTADTVRYLRLHHMADARDFVDDSLMDEIQNSLQPDQLDGGGTYWRLVESYLVRGCLEDVWAFLSRHSLFRRCIDERMEALDDYHTATLAEDREGFEALRALLLSAPLPGGRTDEFDAELDLGDDGEDMALEEELLEGVPPSAHRLWESSGNSRESGDYPVNFEPQAANQMYQSWQQAVKGIPALNRLTRRVPQLQRVLAIMSGDFQGVEFDSWAEEWCAELLYKLPNLRLVDMNVRAARIMKKFESSTKGPFDEVILSVMKGNAGRAIEVMHELGGGSGAALPAVMVRFFSGCFVTTV
jgi:hypothetical protein